VQQKALDPLETSLKFVTDIYNFESDEPDSIVAAGLSERQWAKVVRRSPTLARLRSSDIQFCHFKDYNEMKRLVQDMKNEISEWKNHRERLVPFEWLILASRANKDCESKLSARMDRLRVRYALRLLPLLIDAAESRQAKLEKRAQSTAEAYKRFESYRDAASRIGAPTEITDKLKSLDSGTAAWNEVREEQTTLRRSTEYKQAIALKKQSWVKYRELLLPVYDEVPNSDDECETAAQF
jgi:hypothetical protein